MQTMLFSGTFTYANHSSHDSRLTRMHGEEGTPQTDESYAAVWGDDDLVVLQNAKREITSRDIPKGLKRLFDRKKLESYPERYPNVTVQLETHERADHPGDSPWPEDKLCKADRAEITNPETGKAVTLVRHGESWQLEDFSGNRSDTLDPGASAQTFWDAVVKVAKALSKGEEPPKTGLEEIIFKNDYRGGI